MTPPRERRGARPDPRLNRGEQVGQAPVRTSPKKMREITSDRLSIKEGTLVEVVETDDDRTYVVYEDQAQVATENGLAIQTVKRAASIPTKTFEKNSKTSNKQFGNAPTSEEPK